MYGIIPDSDEVQELISNSYDSLPVHYPTPTIENVIFYIQRNWSTNTICYVPRLTLDGRLNESQPLQILWQRFEEGGKVYPINYIQEKLIYGYHHEKINDHAWQINFVAKPDENFYLIHKEGCFHMIRSYQDEKQIITNVYAYTDNHGAFPKIKSIEFYGTKLDGIQPIFNSISL